MMDIEEIYNRYIVGSDGFVEAVEIYCDFELSRQEIRNLASISPTAEDFLWNCVTRSDWKTQ